MSSTRYVHELAIEENSDVLLEYFFWAVLLSPRMGALRIQRFWEDHYSLEYSNDSCVDVHALENILHIEKVALLMLEEVRDATFITAINKLIESKAKSCQMLLRDFKSRLYTDEPMSAIMFTISDFSSQIQDIRREWELIIRGL